MSTWFFEQMILYLVIHSFHLLAYLFGAGDVSSVIWDCVRRAGMPRQLDTTLWAGHLLLRPHTQNVPSPHLEGPASRPP